MLKGFAEWLPASAQGGWPRAEERTGEINSANAAVQHLIKGPAEAWAATAIFCICSGSSGTRAPSVWSVSQPVALGCPRAARLLPAGLMGKGSLPPWAVLGAGRVQGSQPGLLTRRMLKKVKPGRLGRGRRAGASRVAPL